MADIRLSYDVLGQRWEGVILPTDQWVQLQDATSLLVIARDVRGDLAGFIFDFDTDSSDFAASLRVISESFGDNVADTVSSPSSADPTGAVVTLSGSSLAVPADHAVFPILGSVNGRAREVSIVEDRLNGVIRVSMRLPWWARFLRPWVTVRRRGRPELIALGALRQSGGVHTAELHYGLPAPASSLIAEVIRGTRAAWLSGVLAAVITAVLILGGLALFGPSASPDSAALPVVVVESTVASASSTSAPALATTSTSSTLPVTSTTAAPDTTVPASTTSKPPRSAPTTPSTLLPPGGVSFALPTQYITANDIRADVNVDRIRVKRGESINVSVRVSAVFVNPFDRPGISTLPELIAACRALIGIDVTVPPTPGWSPSVSVSLLGTGASAGGNMQLTVIGNRATECGDVLTSTNPARINVVRITYFREVPLRLTIPSDLQAGKYQLVLDPFPFVTYLKTTPLEITVDD